MKGKEATVVSSNPKTVSLVKQMSKEILEDIRHSEITDEVLSAIRESLSGKKVSLRLLDGEVQSMTPSQGEALARAYDRLSESNQHAFLILAAEGREAFTHGSQGRTRRTSNATDCQDQQACRVCHGSNRE